MIYCKDTKERCKTYQEYLQSTHWSRVRKQYAKDHVKRCKVCRSKKRIHLHHTTYKHLGDERDNELVWLCEVCHGRVHGLAKGKNTPYLRHLTFRMRLKILNGRRIRGFLPLFFYIPRYILKAVFFCLKIIIKVIKKCLTFRL